MIEIPSAISSNGPSQTSLANSSTTPDKPEEQSSEIQCICGFHDDDGFTICCDQCDTWQHLYCVDIRQDRVPESYLCPNCLPRPLDVRRAKEHQQSRREREDKDKIRRKRQKTNTNANISRRRDHTNNNNNNNINTTQSNGPGPPTADKGVGPGKPTSPKEGQQHSRKRGSHRASISNATGNNVLPELSPPAVESTVAGTVATAVSSPGIASNNDRNMDIDSDTDMDKPTKYKYDFTDIAASADYYSTRDVQAFVTSIAAQRDASIRHYTLDELENLPMPKVSVHDVPDLTTSYSSLPQYFITLDAPCPALQLVAFYKGDIAFQQSYKNDAINQYSLLRHPKPYVLFHPSLPLCIDSRIRGTVARFVKRSCRPNLSLQTIVVDNSEVLFGLVAMEPLKANSVLTVEWEWSGSPAIQSLILGTEPDQLNAEERQEASAWINNLTSNIGECACIDKKECIFTRFKAQREVVFTKPYLNGKGALPLRHRNIFSERNSNSLPDTIIKQLSPERYNATESKESVSRVKAGSRDLSPSTVNYEGPDGAEMSSRELRKMKNIVSRIQKLEQDQPVVNKRRKKNNATPTPVLATELTPSSPADLKDPAKASDSGKKTKHPNAVSSPPSTSFPSGMLLAHTSAPSRRYSESQSVNSDDIRISSNLPTQVSSTPEKSKTPVIRIKKPVYVDVSIQTDPCDDSWLPTIFQDVPARPEPMSLRERLLREHSREWTSDWRKVEKWEAEHKKRRRELEEAVPDCKTKELRLINATDVKSVNQVAAPSLSGEPSEDLPGMDVEVTDTPSDYPIAGTTTSLSNLDSLVAPDSNLSVKSLPTDATDSQTTSTEGQNPTEKDDVPTSVVPDVVSSIAKSPTANGHRKVGLLVQLPPPLDFLATPPTSANTSTSPVLTPSGPLHSPPALSFPSLFSPSTATSVSHTNVQPSPIKTKKLSLSEYGNRRKKADANDKDRSGSFSGKPFPNLASLPEDQKMTRNGDGDHPLSEVSQPMNDVSS